MGKLIQLAASLAICASAAAVRAQISNPNDLVSGPPKPPRTRDAERQQSAKAGAASLQWLWTYAQPKPNGNAVALRTDERFELLLSTHFKQPQAFWGKPVPIADVIPRFLSRYGEITTKGNRYWMVDGCVPSFCAAHGMLWADLGVPQPLLIFAAVNWTTENHTTDEANADYDLWLFASRQTSPDALPLALSEGIADWDARLAQAHRGVPHIVHAILVEPDGQPFSLSPAQVGANTLPPQPDTVTPKSPEGQ